MRCPTAHPHRLHRSLHRPARAGLALLCLAALAGCELLYDARLQSELRDCEQRVSQTEVMACRNRITAQQKAFRQEQAGGGRPAAKPAAGDGQPAKSDGCFIRQATGEKVCPN